MISPLLANLYLNPLDHLMAGSGYEMTRYADDLVVQCRSEAEAVAALAKLRRWAEENGLTVHPIKTRIVNAREKGGSAQESRGQWSGKRKGPFQMAKCVL